MVTPAFESGVIFSSPAVKQEISTPQPFSHPALSFFPSPEKGERERLIVAFVSALVVIVPEFLRARDYFVAGEPELEFVFGGIYSAVGLAALLFLGGRIFSRARDDIRGRRLSTDFLAALSLSFLAVAIGFAWGFASDGQQIQSLAGALILVCSVVTIENFFSRRFYTRIASSLGFDIFKIVPRVRIIESMAVSEAEAPAGFELGNAVRGIEEGWVDLKAIKPGQLLRLREGELVTADGLAQDGVAKVLERRVGGVSRMKLKARGDELFAGSVVLKGEITLKVTASAEDSMITTFTSALGRGLLPAAAEEKHFSRLLGWTSGLLLGLSVASLVYHVLSGTAIAVALGISASILLATAALRAIVLHGLLSPLVTTALFFRGVILRDRRAFERLLSVRSLLVESPMPGEKYEVSDFELLDDRLQKKTVLSVLLALVSRADDEMFATLGDSLIRKEKELLPLEVQDGRVYAGLGVCGTINRVEFSVGSEEFLIKRGVQLQPSELERGNGSREILYLAMDDAIIGRLVICREPFSNGRAMIGALKEHRINTVLCSPRGTPVAADESGGLGLDSSLVERELSPARYIEKLQGLRPAAFLASDSSARELIAASDVSFSLFDTFAWKLDRTDFTLFTRNVQVIVEVLRAAIGLRRATRIYLPLAISLSLVLAALCWFSILSAGACAAVAAVVHFVLLSLVLRVSAAAEGQARPTI